jgi:hypothetical protein
MHFLFEKMKLLEGANYNLTKGASRYVPSTDEEKEQMRKHYEKLREIGDEPPNDEWLYHLLELNKILKIFKIPSKLGCDLSELDYSPYFLRYLKETPKLTSLSIPRLFQVFVQKEECLEAMSQMTNLRKLILYAPSYAGMN